MIFIVSSIQKSNRGLGFENDLLWKIPADLKRFRDLTTGHPTIMGRKTWDSLPAKFRPLPNRTNIVVSSRSEGFEGALVFRTLTEAVTEAKKIDSDISIIGGAGIFKEALKFTDNLYLTEIEGTKETDVFFPEFINEFEQVKSEGPFETSDGIKYYFIEYKKK